MKKGLVDPSPGSNSPRAQQSLGPPVLGPTSINMQIKKIFTRTSGSKEQWTLIPIVENYSRTTGPQYQWALGLVGFAKVGRCQDQWTLVLKNSSTLRPKYIWTLGLMDPRTSGPRDQWVIPISHFHRKHKQLTQNGKDFHYGECCAFMQQGRTDGLSQSQQQAKRESVVELLRHEVLPQSALRPVGKGDSQSRPTREQLSRRDQGPPNARFPEFDERMGS